MIPTPSASTHRAHINVIVDRATRETATRVEVGIITKSCPGNIQRNFSALKIENVIRKILMIFIGLLKTLIVGTR